MRVLYMKNIIRMVKLANLPIYYLLYHKSAINLLFVIPTAAHPSFLNYISFWGACEFLYKLALSGNNFPWGVLNYSYILLRG